MFPNDKKYILIKYNIICKECVYKIHRIHTVTCPISCSHACAVTILSASVTMTLFTQVRDKDGGS